MSARRSAVFFAVPVALTVAALARADESPRGISPGDPAASVGVNTTCPTFSWSGVERSTGYELALYPIRLDGALGSATEIRLAGDARAWTPSIDRCPDSGREYAWAVRAMTKEGPGGWSDLLLFETPGAPTEDEVRRALEVLRRYEPVASHASVRRGQSGTEPPGSDSSGTDSSGTEARRHPLGIEPITADTVVDSTPQVVTSPSVFALSLDGDLDLGGFVFKNGDSFLHNLGGNTGVGTSALTSVNPNFFNQTGLRNSAIGTRSLFATTDGNDNTAVGREALVANVDGSQNTAVGVDALVDNVGGHSNTAVGFQALSSNVNAGYNTAIGFGAMSNVPSGSNNVAIGRDAGSNWTVGESGNIAIRNDGEAGDSGTIRIGNQLTSRAFIGGIFGVTPPNASVQVVIDDEGQLGAPVSSARFKRDVRDLEDLGERLLALRPVSFYYKGDGTSAERDADRPLEYGLIAEEVAKVFPELVVDGADGKPFTVRYQLLTPLLLAEVQRQRDEIEQLRELKEEVTDLRRQLGCSKPEKRWWKR